MFACSLDHGKVDWQASATKMDCGVSEVELIRAAASRSRLQGFRVPGSRVRGFRLPGHQTPWFQAPRPQGSTL